MEGEINVAAIMEAHSRSESEAESFVQRQWSIRVTNALWAYHKAWDKAEVVRLYQPEFIWINKR
jgi:hypothetical protein